MNPARKARRFSCTDGLRTAAAAIATYCCIDGAAAQLQVRFRTDFDPPQPPGSYNPGWILTSERGYGANIELWLDGPPHPGMPVEVRFTPRASSWLPDDRELLVTPAAIVFTDADWAVPRVVTVVGLNDSIADGDQNLQLTTEIVTPDPRFNAFAGPAFPITNADDEVPADDCLLQRNSVSSGSTNSAGGGGYNWTYDSATGEAVTLGSDGHVYRLRGSEWRPVSTIPLALDHSFEGVIAYDEARACLVYHGSVQGNPVDTYEFDGTAWLRRTFGQQRPESNRDGAFVYDAGRQRCLLFGGYDTTTQPWTVRGDTWEWDGVAWQSVSTAQAPSPRVGAAMTYDSSRGRVLLFGGYDGVSWPWGGLNNELWEYAGGAWNLLPAGGPPPSYLAGLVYDPLRDLVVLHSGVDTYSMPPGLPTPPQLFEWNPVTNVWMPVPFAYDPLTPYVATNSRDWGVFDWRRCKAHFASGIVYPDYTSGVRISEPFRQTFALLGPATGANWSWRVGQDPNSVSELNVTGVAPGGTAADVAARFVDSVNSRRCPAVFARTVDPPGCFEIFSRIAVPELRVGPPGDPNCLLVTGSECVFNPTIRLVQDSGQDCNGNGLDDAREIATGAARDADGNGVPDECERRPGDLNCDGALNNFDIDPFVLALSDAAGYAARYPNCDRRNADVNGDGQVDNFDIDAFVALLGGG